MVKVLLEKCLKMNLLIMSSPLFSLPRLEKVYDAAMAADRPGLCMAVHLRRIPGIGNRGALASPRRPETAFMISDIPIITL